MARYKAPSPLTDRRPSEVGPADGTPVASHDLAAAATQGSAKQSGRSWAAFRYVSFRYLWAGSVFSSSAMFIQQIALNWLVYDLTNSPLMLGLVNGLRFLPMALTAPFAGVLADRGDRRQLILVTQVYLMVSALLFAFDVALDHVALWHIFVFTFLMGVGNGLNATSRQSVLPQVVPRETLVSAVAWTSVSQNATRTVGPAIGGVLISAFGMATNFFIQAGCYVGTFASIFPIKTLHQAGSGPKQRQPFFRSMAEGFRYMVTDKPVFSLMVLGLVPMFFIFPLQTLIPIFARDVFHKGASGYGIFLMAMGLGSLLGTLALAGMAEIRHKAAVFYVLLTVAIGSSIIFAWTRFLPLALLLLAGQGAAQMTYFSMNNATLQMRVPDSVLGRVMSVNTLNVALIPLGGLVAGLLAEILGAPMALTIIGGVGLLFVVGAALTLRSVRDL